ncbi:MAG TPA: rhomboid family intramembrane serine protease [Nevskiaceae bacterium]|nr:rhomboid family intramembrane serine protease [Nevskiaceae bacterium]
MPAPIVWLLALNLAGFGVELALGEDAITLGALWPLGAGFAPWQLLTSAFLHAGIAHLATNMFGLWMFGRDVARVLGARWFLALYGASVLSAALAQLAVTSLGDPVPTLGASGGVFGVLGAFAMLFPRRPVALLFPPVVLPSRVFVVVYALIELASGMEGWNAGVAHYAHLGGLAGGWWVMRRWRRAAA